MSDKQQTDSTEQGLGVQEILQVVEDALIQAGFDDYTISTQHGTFHWTTVERARARNG